MAKFTAVTVFSALCFFSALAEIPGGTAAQSDALTAETKRLVESYTRQAYSEPFLARLASDDAVAGRLLSAVAALQLEIGADAPARPALRERTDVLWRQLAAGYPDSLAVQVNRLAYCALRDDPSCNRLVAKALVAFHPDNAWGPILHGIADWEADRAQSRAWFHSAPQRPSGNLAVWQSSLLIHDALRRHIEPAADDRLARTPAALLEVALSIQARQVHPVRLLQRVCSRSAAPADLDACLAAARALESADDLVLTRMVSLGMQSQYLQQLGRSEALQLLEQRLAEFREWADSTSAIEPGYSLAFVQAMARHGEITVRQMDLAAE